MCPPRSTADFLPLLGLPSAQATLTLWLVQAHALAKVILLRTPRETTINAKHSLQGQQYRIEYNKYMQAHHLEHLMLSQSDL